MSQEYWFIIFYIFHEIGIKTFLKLLSNKHPKSIYQSDPIYINDIYMIILMEMKL